ncbi:hypothetical protein [Atlantibacter hermannii]|uniref:hypothetical protein n=1 Tax=Atlantibacter hermannii TaxID=565 RepID=UPI0034D66354
MADPLLRDPGRRGNILSQALFSSDELRNEFIKARELSVARGIGMLPLSGTTGAFGIQDVDAESMMTLPANQAYSMAVNTSTRVEAFRGGIVILPDPKSRIFSGKRRSARVRQSMMMLIFNTRK